MFLNSLTKNLGIIFLVSDHLAFFFIDEIRKVFHRSCSYMYCRRKKALGEKRKLIVLSFVFLSTVACHLFISSVLYFRLAFKKLIELFYRRFEANIIQVFSIFSPHFILLFNFIPIEKSGLNLKGG